MIIGNPVFARLFVWEARTVLVLQCSGCFIVESLWRNMTWQQTVQMQYRYSILKYKAVRVEDKLQFNIYIPRRRLQLHFIKTITPVIIWFVSLPDPKHPALTICDKYKSHPSFTYLIFTLSVTQHKQRVKSKCVTAPYTCGVVDNADFFLGLWRTLLHVFGGGFGGLSPKKLSRSSIKYILAILHNFRLQFSPFVCTKSWNKLEHIIHNPNPRKA